MSGEVFLAEFFAELLRFIHRQSVIRSVPWIKTDDIVMGFNFAAVQVFAVSLVCPKTGDGEIVPAAVQSGEAVITPGNEPSLFIKYGLHAYFIMLEGQILFCGGVVRVFRADMSVCIIYIFADIYLHRSVSSQKEEDCRRHGIA